jgi:2-oxoglutarate dehydrogenase E1 component
MPAHDFVLDSANLTYVEQLYARYLTDPLAVDPAWRDPFEQWKKSGAPQVPPAPQFKPRSIFHPAGNGHPPANGAAAQRHEQDIGSLQHRVDKLVRNYRVRGHIVAELDPLGSPSEQPPELDPAYYGFTEADMDKRVFAGTMPGGPNVSLREVIRKLRATYCRHIGVQFMHIDALQVREWLQERMEGTENSLKLSRAEQIRILTRLTDAVIFEQFIQKKFIGAKSFSLEGAESLIPLLDLALEKAGQQDVREMVIGMAHRGRLNVLANIIGKSPQQIFREFEDVDPELYIGGGDVKYHLGYSGEWQTRAGKNIHLSLCFNPSHLEFVNPVVLGRMRAKQDRSNLASRGQHGVALLIHGDAAFAGEGVVQETLNLSELQGYTVGGTLHIVVNNQIGFTTSPPEGRSSRYATDVARLLQIPIFHVNGENPEAVAQVVHLAMEFRATFKRDVVIDMYCYRRRGHNEGDEPSYTQPEMYQAIEKRKTVREAYLDNLLGSNGIDEKDAEHIVQRRTELLEKELAAARADDYTVKPLAFGGAWSRYVGGKEAGVPDVDTAVPHEQLSQLLEHQTQLPPSFHVHPKITRLLKLKQEMAQGKRRLDWVAAESLAMASLSLEGHRIRLSGQDSQRGTFSQRHAVLHDIEDGHTYMPLQHLAREQGPVEIVNSPLSETGVLGFEYGYSLDCPDGLVMWEAQFGDFVNAAQVIIDQFIASAEDKWRRVSGLVLLLPHGFEGQGPEHSSARLERFLMLAAEDNIQVAQPSTPAQYFHLLRRQVIRPWRKPLIVLTPKSLLRHPLCVSSLADFATGTYRRVIEDQPPRPPQGVSRVLLCSGKVYYDLLEHREKAQRHDVAILRMEQYYPFPAEPLRAALAPYNPSTPVVWVQDEPANMGAWPFLKGLFCHRLLDRYPLTAATRPASSSPATGSRAAHQIEQQRLLAAAFAE